MSVLRSIRHPSVRTRHPRRLVLGDILALAGPLHAQGAAPPARLATSAWAGVYTLGQAQRGAEVATMCASCHGLDLDGSVDQTPPLAGPVFLAKWEEWTLGDMFERIVAEVRTLTRRSASTGATTVADDGESRRLQQSADVLAYLLQMNRLPSGETELPPNIEWLRQIRFAQR